MRVLVTSSSFPADSDDWKGLFILRMLEGLSARDDLRLSAWCPPGPLPDRVDSALQLDDAAWFSRMAARGGLAHLLRRHPASGLTQGLQLLWRLHRACRATRPDLFHVNWLQCALGLPTGRTPALVTALGTDLQMLRLPLVRRLLARRFAARRVVLCPNADWMVPVLRRAFGPDVPVRCVPFGIDGAWYDTPRVPDPAQSLRWLCVTRLTGGKLGPLFDWARDAFSHGRELHLIGPQQEAGLKIPDWVNYHGPVSPAQLREDWFPHAAGLVSLSTHPEGRPQVMLEAMAAGLPVLASSNPAHLDLVQHRRTGWLCDDRATFKAGLDYIENPTHNRALGDQARQDARQRFGDWSDCAARYTSLYGELLQ